MAVQGEPRVGPAAADMTGRVAIVTGGSKGIGAGCAHAFVAAGATVVIVARDAVAGAATANRLSSEGPGRCIFQPTDVSDFTTVRRVIDDVVTAHGRLDTLVNNAVLFPGWRPIDDVGEDLITETLRVNIGAYIVGSQAALPHLRRTRGSIINVSSIAGAVGGWHDALYSATKGAITSFTKALAVEEAANGVRVNAILPGNILTEARVRSEASVFRGQDFHDYLERWQWMGRSGTIEEVGNAALFLASEMASFSTGISLVISGGLEIGYGVKEPYPDFA
jgi:NAD(P)-dependent dehydrogenase (short-subunit alcohol dehydrogenase family)